MDIPNLKWITKIDLIHDGNQAAVLASNEFKNFNWIFRLNNDWIFYHTSVEKSAPVPETKKIKMIKNRIFGRNKLFEWNLREELSAKNRS